MGLVENLGKQDVRVGHVRLGEQSLSKLSFGGFVFPHLMGHDGQTSLESGIGGEGCNGAGKGLGRRRCSAPSTALPAGLVVVELGGRAQIGGFLVGVSDLVVIGTLVLENLNLKEPGRGVE